MAGIITRMLKQTAVYWPVAGHDQFGKVILGEGVEIKCRWEDAGVLYATAVGEQRVSTAVVYVDRDLEMGGYLWLGYLADAPALPLKDKKVIEIKIFSKVPNLRNTQVLRTAML